MEAISRRQSFSEKGITYAGKRKNHSISVPERSAISRAAFLQTRWQMPLKNWDLM